MTVAGTVTVEPLVPELASRWDDFVANADDATFFHRAAWREVIEHSFGHRCYYFIASRGDRITGVLPLVHIDSPLFGNALISTAFCVYGGPVASDEASRAALDRMAIRKTEELGVGHLEYRLRRPSGRDWRRVSDLYATFRKPLSGDPEVDLTSIPRKRRAMLRKAAAAGLSSRLDTDIDRFYPIYATSVRDLGTPVFSRRFFRSLLQTFGDDCEVLTVDRGDTPLSSVINFYFRDQVLPYYGGSIAAGRSLAANDFMYWEVMRRASQRGARMFDFGRSKQGTGAFAYKCNWGFSPEPLHYEYHLLQRRDVPNVNPLNPKYRLFIAGWKRLPLAVANIVGPHLAKDLG
jgi:FemAB-related protein (PEP-CTERM system-associated)